MNDDVRVERALKGVEGKRLTYPTARGAKSQALAVKAALAR